MGDNNTAVAQDSSSPGSRDGRGRGSRARDGAETQQMQMTIDSQSFVNLGQLMGSRGSVSGAVGGPSSNTGGAGSSNLFMSSFLSDESQDSDGLRDFDQIFHPSASTSSAWSGHDLGSYGEDVMDGDEEEGEEDEGEDGDNDDDDSVLPALPPRSPAPESPAGSDLNRSVLNSGPSDPSSVVSNAAATAGTGAGIVVCAPRDEFAAAGSDLPLVAVSSGDTPIENETVTAVVTPDETPRGSFDEYQDTTHSTAAVSAKEDGGSSRAVIKTQPSVEATEGSAGMPSDASDSVPTTSFLRESWLHVPLDDSEVDARSSEEDTEQTAEDDAGDEQEHLSAVVGATARRAINALCRCGECLACGVEKGVALAKPPLQQAAWLAKARVDAGLDVCARGQRALVKTVDSVPQAPVRLWLGRIAGSLVLGAILGGGAAYYTLPRAGTASSSSPSCASGDATSPWWNTPAGGHSESAKGGAEQGFGDRLNKALFAARAGEAAAQQGLLEEVRNILAATGKSGGISAEQILRQFNARRFAEASKAWSAAEGIAGSDPLDPLFFPPPVTPVYKTSPSSTSQHHHSSPHRATPEDCLGGSDGGSFCSVDGAGGSGGGGSRHHHPRAGVGSAGGSGDSTTGSSRPIHRRPCAGGGWVC